MDNAYHIFTSSLDSMVNEAENGPRSILKAWGNMGAAQNAAEAFASFPEDDPNVRSILKACGGQFTGVLTTWLGAQREILKSHHEATTRTVDGKVVQVSAFDDKKQAKQKAPAEEEKEHAKTHLSVYTKKANEIGSAAHKLTTNMEENDLPTADDHGRASKAHAHAARLHMDTQKMAEMAGDGLAAAHHNEMSNHHSELHAQHKHNITKPNEIYRADTKPIYRAQDAMKKHYSVKV